MLGDIPIFIVSAKTYRLPNKSRKNGKNTKLVLLDWLRLYLQEKNIYSCEVFFLPLLEFKSCLDSLISSANRLV